MFNEGIHMKCSWSGFKSGSENQDPQAFPDSTWEQRHIFVISTFWILDFTISDNTQANP